MGCGNSKPAKTARTQRRPRRNIEIGAPQQVLIHVPRNRLDEHGAPIQQVTRDIPDHVLLVALNHVSNYIAQRGQHMSIVAVGGAVNTLYLRSRTATHDVDIFGSDFDNNARILLDAAMEDAQRHIPELGTDWINTETQMWMPGPLHQQLTAQARKQNVRVFDGAGLLIFAAPWEYAFSAKVNRLLTGGDQVRPYDLSDAVSYIHQYIRAHGNQPVAVATALGWARHYHHEANENIIRNRVDREYQRVHGGRHAFV